MNTDVTPILNQLKQSGVKITLEFDGRIRCRSSSEIPEELLVLVRESKAALTVYLKDQSSKQTLLDTPPKPEDEEEGRTASTNASARSYRSRYGGGPPILRSVWCPERGWLEWNPVTKAHDIPITDDDRLEMLVAQDERDAIQSEE